MKSFKLLATILGFCCYFILYELILPYDNYVAHPTINEVIVKYFDDNMKTKIPKGYTTYFSKDLTKLEGAAVTNSGFTEATYGESVKEYTILEWIKHGGFSADEPELAAAVRHFYDPVGLDHGKKYLTNRGTWWESVYPNPGIDAIEWALGDTPKGLGNVWSLLTGKLAIRDALQAVTDEDKNKYFAKAFRCLGEVLHNTADMGCPPHVRNDSHAAPIGYTGGYVLGSPDPYEELFDPAFVSAFSIYTPDPSLKSFFENATTIRSINEKLAEYTNKNFFSDQTIIGVGKELYAPINLEGTYTLPMLHALTYEEGEYTYFKTFPDGALVRMCKDYRYFASGLRGYPYIDYECAESQARVLIPNIISAGINVIRLFIPKLKLEITKAQSGGTVEGKVTHETNAEYQQTIRFNGKIDLYNAKTSLKISSATCLSGNFTSTLPEISDSLYAKISFGGITIQSEKVSPQNLGSVSITPDPLNGKVNSECTFKANPSGSIPNNLKYIWSFGVIGQLTKTKINVDTVKYTYKNPGTYDVTLWLYDNSTNLQIATANSKAIIADVPAVFKTISLYIEFLADRTFDPPNLSVAGVQIQDIYTNSNKKLSWNGNNFSITYTYKKPISSTDTTTVSGVITGSLTDDGNSIVNLNAEENKSTKLGNTFQQKIIVKNLPFNENTQIVVRANYSGPQVANYIQSYDLKRHTWNNSTGQWEDVKLVSTNYNSSVLTPTLRIEFLK